MANVSIVETMREQVGGSTKASLLELFMFPCWVFGFLVMMLTISFAEHVLVALKTTLSPVKQKNFVKIVRTL